MRNIVIIAGNGGLAYSSECITNLVKNLENNINVENVLCIGDGERDISLGEIKENISSLGEKLDEPTTIIIQNHGDIQNGKFMFIGNKEEFSSEDLYGIIGENFNNCDIINTACKGGASLEDTEKLKKGTKVVALSNTNESTYGGQAEALYEHLDEYDGEINSDVLLSLYLTKCVRNRGSVPQIKVAGDQNKINLEDTFKQKLGKKLNINKIQQASEGFMDESEIIEFADKFENAKNEWSFYALEYGRAIAIAMYDEYGNTQEESQENKFDSLVKDIMEIDDEETLLKIEEILNEEKTNNLDSETNETNIEL